MSSKKINSLQLLRALAVVLVIFIHASFAGIPEISKSNPLEYFFNIKSWGAIGVDLFFSISGFIMTIIIPAYIKPQGWKKFFIKRFIRILPLYYLLSVCEFFAVARHHVLPPLAVIIKSIIFFPFFDDKAFTVPLIGVGWSLSYEMYFYVLIGLILITGGNIYKKLLILIITLSTGGVILDPRSPLLKFLLSPLLLEFALGIICGLSFERLKASRISLINKKGLAVVLMIVGAILMLSTIFISPNAHLYSPFLVENNDPAALERVFLWGIPCAMFILGVVLVVDEYQLAIPGLLVLCGDASYSCYLIHWHMCVWISHICRHLPYGILYYLIIVVPVIMALSILFYKVVEQPLINASNQLFQRKTAATP